MTTTEWFKLLGSIGVVTFFASTFSNSAQTQTPTVLDEAHYNKRGNSDFDSTVLSFFKGELPKIVGGRPAAPGAYPWQVSLQVSWIADPVRAHFCGGSMYDANWIVTAAHCTEGLAPGDIIVMSGTNQLRGSIRRVNVQRVVVHKSYDPKTQDNDVALLRLMQPLALDNSVQSVPLLQPAEEADVLNTNPSLWVTGWGATTEGGGVVRVLNEVSVPYVPRDICNDPLSYGGRVTENMICAGFRAGGQDSCQGDSGGPAVTRTSNSVRLVGIVSWGDGCAKPGKYGIYTRVARFSEWIRKCAGKPDDCQ